MSGWLANSGRSLTRKNEEKTGVSSGEAAKSAAATVMDLRTGALAKRVAQDSPCRSSDLRTDTQSLPQAARRLGMRCLLWVRRRWPAALLAAAAVTATCASISLLAQIPGAPADAPVSALQRAASPFLAWAPAGPDAPQIRSVGPLSIADDGGILAVKSYPPPYSPPIVATGGQPSGAPAPGAGPREFFLVALAMMRNKAEHVAEWIEFHLLQGFDRFVIYDHLSTDNLHEVLAPYVRAGIVELVVWPLDFDATARPPLGPRVWPNDTHRTHFEKVFDEECMHVRDTWHLHGGCQRSAMLEAISRYRNRAVWLSIFDVDEFFFVPLSGSERGDFSSVATIRDALSTLGHTYDHIRVPGKIFGTSGYFRDPPLSVNFSRRLVTEAYRFRMNHENETRWQEFYLRGRSYSEKSFVRAHLATGTLIHHFVFDGIDPRLTFNNSGVREISVNSSVIALNHYQYLSHLGQNKKVLENTNWALDYWRPVDAFLSEITDYSIGHFVPIVEANLHRRGAIQSFDKVTLANIARRNAERVRKNKSKNSKVDLCIAFTHVEGHAHNLRRAVSTIIEYLKTTEPGIVFRTVLAANNRTAPGDASMPELAYLRDLLVHFDTIDILPSHSFWVNAFDRATQRCIETGAAYTLFMEDVWETRVQTGSLSDYSRPGLNIPLLRQAMDLMEQEKDILEVWVGDTPIRPREYRHVQGQWIRARFMPEFDKTVSNMRLLRQQIDNAEVRDAVWEDLLQKYMHELGVVHRFGTKGANQYKQHVTAESEAAESTTQSRDITSGGLVWNTMIWLFGAKYGIGATAATRSSQADALRLQRARWEKSYGNHTVKHGSAKKKPKLDKRQASVDDDNRNRNFLLSKRNADDWAIVSSPIDQTLGSEGAGLKTAPGGDASGEVDVSALFTKQADEARRKRELAKEFYDSAALKLGCIPQTECLSRVTYFRIQGAQGSGLAVVRLGGTLKHNGRLQSLGMTWLGAADASPSHASMLSVQETYGRVAAAQGFKSAHICLAAPEFAADCDLNPDFLGDKAVTGIMWRQRLVLGSENGLLVFPDRPRE